MLSIIIPHFNSPGTLKKLLESIPHEAWLEIIVVDDQSTQGLDEYNRLTQDPGFAHVRFLENKGVKSAGTCRNTGVDNAKGEWLMFADADDFFLPGFSEVIAKYLDTDYDIVFFKLTSVDLLTGAEATRHLFSNKLMNNYNSNHSRLDELRMRYNMPHPFSKLISAGLVAENNIRFDETAVSNDTRFSSKAGHYMRKFHVSDEIFYCITASGGTLTTAVVEENYLIRAEVAVKSHAFLRSVLSKEDYKSLQMSMMMHLLYGFISGYKLKTIFKAIRIFRRNKIPLFIPGRYFSNPVDFFKKIGGLLKKLMREVRAGRRYAIRTDSKKPPVK
jgi:glycosyltransferase involved in cell wall biosynthesis